MYERTDRQKNTERMMEGKIEGLKRTLRVTGKWAKGRMNRQQDRQTEKNIE